MFKKQWAAIFLFFSLYAYAQDEYIIPLEDMKYRQAEELFLESGWVPPLNQKPMIAARLKNLLVELINEGELPPESLQKARDLKTALNKESFPLTPIVATALSANFTTKTNRKHMINTGDRHFLDHLSVYQVDNIPTLLKLGFITQLKGFSILFMPQIGATLSSRLMDPVYMNFPRHPGESDSILPDLKYTDNSFPYKGIATFYGYPVEFRIGRDKLQVGPAQWSGMVLTPHIPYFDYFKGALHSDIIDYNMYFIRLNNTISIAEGQKLDAYYNETEKNPETYYFFVGQSYNDRAKHLLLGSVDFKIFRSLHFEINQIHLISGRHPQLPDFNPFIIAHNLFMEGSYSVPFSASFTYVPFKGIKIFGDYYQYDMQSDEESGDVNLHPTALAYQCGFTLLSAPFFKLGPGRFRLDGELTHVDPWTYNLFHSYRKMTSRFIFVENYIGRFWVDFPLGFYLGADCKDFHFALSYGVPADWEAQLDWQLSGIGEIDLFGWGDNSDYGNMGDPGLETDLKAPSGTVYWSNRLTLSGYKFLMKCLKFSFSTGLEHVVNSHHVENDNHLYFNLSLQLEWSLN